MSKVQLTDEALKAISDAILAGAKIEAIKRYQNVTGEGLKEAKTAIEEIEASIAKKHPGLIKPKGGGCAAILVLGAITSLSIYHLISGGST